jgi:class 3 adenylate cyclase
LNRAETALTWRGTLADPALEREFQRDELASRRAFLCFSLGLSSVVFVAYALHDALLVPSVRNAAWAVRFGVFVPCAALVLLVVRADRLARFLQPAMLLFGAAVSFVVLFIAAIAPAHGYFIYTSYAVLFVTLGPFIAQMSVVTQAGYTALTLLLYLGLSTTLAHGQTMTISGSITATLLAMGGIGTLLSYQLERQARQRFLQRRLIKEKVEALATEQKRSEALLLNVLPLQIAERLKAGQRSIADGFANVSVLFADIVGFTKMSTKLPPEELVARLNAVFSSFDDLVDKLKLEKIKTIGDAYMVAGGLHSHEYDHAQAVAEMALAMRRRAEAFSQDFGEALSIRIGINTGPVVAGVIGKRKFIYDVWGDTVNTASRMESHSEPGNIQVTESTYKLLKELYEFAPRGEIEVKGKGPMRTWYLLGRRSLDGRQGTQIPRKVAAG